MMMLSFIGNFGVGKTNKACLLVRGYNSGLEEETDFSLIRFFLQSVVVTGFKIQ